MFPFQILALLKLLFLLLFSWRERERVRFNVTRVTCGNNFAEEQESVVITLRRSRREWVCIYLVSTVLVVLVSAGPVVGPHVLCQMVFSAESEEEEC